MSSVVHQAMDIVRENGLDAAIELKHGRLEELTELEGRKFDVIVSEWMGYFLLFEGENNSWPTSHCQSLFSQSFATFFVVFATC